MLQTLKQFRQFLTSPKSSWQGMGFKYLAWAMVGALIGAAIYFSAPAWIAAIATIVGFHIGLGLVIAAGVLAGEVLGVMGTLVATLLGATPDDLFQTNPKNDTSTVAAPASIPSLDNPSHGDTSEAKALYQAVRDGDEAKVRELVADVDFSSESRDKPSNIGSTELDKALYMATVEDHVAIATILLQHKHQASCVAPIVVEHNPPGVILDRPATNTALKYAFDHQNEAMIQAFIDSYEKPDGLLCSCIAHKTPDNRSGIGKTAKLLFDRMTEKDPTLITIDVIEVASGMHIRMGDSVSSIIQTILQNPTTYSSVNKDDVASIVNGMTERGGDVRHNDFFKVCTECGVELKSAGGLGHSMKCQ